MMCCTAVDAAGDAGWMKERLLWATDKLNLSNADKDARLSHWHFSTLPLTGLSDVGANFIPYLMGRWRASKKILTASESGAVSCNIAQTLVAFHAHAHNPIDTFLSVI